MERSYGFLSNFASKQMIFMAHIGELYHKGLLPEAFHHTLKWWKSSGCLWTSHQPFLQLIRFILWFNKRVDGGLRWYVYVYWGRRNTRMHTGILAQLFNIWVTGPGNPNNSSKLRATLSATLESQSNTITASFCESMALFQKLNPKLFSTYCEIFCH